MNIKSARKRLYLLREELVVVGQFFVRCNIFGGIDSDPCIAVHIPLLELA